MGLEIEIKELLREVIREELQNFSGGEIEKLLTADEVAERLGCGKQTVYRLRRENHIQAVMISETQMGFAPEVIRKFIREQGTKHVATTTDSGLECASEVSQ